MGLQAKIIKQFNKHFNSPTLREISSLTGINTSRIFRILRGGEMKLKEFEIFCNCLSGKEEEKSSNNKQYLLNLINPKAVEEIESVIEGKIKLQRWLKIGGVA